MSLINLVKGLAGLLAGSMLTTAAAAQVGEPLSAIDWLSRSVAIAPALEPPAVRNAAAPDVTTSLLGRPSKDPVGLLPPATTGLPRALWALSNEAVLVDLLRAERRQMLPALQDLMTVMLLAKADPPAGAAGDGALFLARVDKLLDIGALDPAQSLIQAANPDTAALFRRWFDVALLTGTEDAACDEMGNRPTFAPTLAARIFCLARTGDWGTAVLTLNTHRVLGDITPDQEALLTRFLDPELFEGEPPLPRPDRVSPLTFRMHAAIGEPLITATLPLAFSHADLQPTAAWRARIEAAERLARHGAISENVLLQIYTARKPAASGGIWDRVAAMQRFDQAMSTNDPSSVADHLPDAWNAMRAIQAEVLFARIYGLELQQIALTGPAGDLAYRIGLLSPAYLAIAANDRPEADPFITAIARGRPHLMPANTPRMQAIQAGFDGRTLPPDLGALLENGEMGEALLHALDRFETGARGDLRLVTDALQTIRAAGLEDTARRAALQLMLLDRD